MQTIYYIGGSPCSGKSTVAEILQQRFDFTYYKYDDYLFEYLHKTAIAGKPTASRYAAMTLDETWLREPETLCREAIALYWEYFEYAQADIKALGNKKPIVAEGAAFLPELMQKTNVSTYNYICIVPTFDFQYQKYSKRTWISDYLSGCSDKDTAFENLMKRDNLFAEIVKNDAETLGYETVTVNGQRPVNDLAETVINVFRLGLSV